MSTNKNIIKCPHCGKTVDVSEILYKEIESQLTEKYQRDFLEKERNLKEMMSVVESQKREIEEERNRLDKEIDERVRIRIESEKNTLKEEIKKRVMEENLEQINALKKELSEKHDQLKSYKHLEIELEKIRREKEELQEKITLEKEKEFSKKIREEREKIRKIIEEEMRLKVVDKDAKIEELNLKLKEKDKTIEDMKIKAEEAKRKAEEGSIQLKGEVQEMELRDILSSLFPDDEILDVKAGQRGGDVIQVVKSKYGEVYGKIYYESKRTKEFKSNWINKLKEDNRQEKADILVIVTATMPDDVEKFCIRDGVWICKFSEITHLSLILRYLIEKVYQANIVQKDRKTKMDLIYNFLTGNEFKSQFESIVRGFMNLQDNYTKERNSMMKIWSEREKQLRVILDTIAEMYGSIKGIIGSSNIFVNELEMDTYTKSLNPPSEK